MMMCFALGGCGHGNVCYFIVSLRVFLCLFLFALADIVVCLCARRHEELIA